MPRFDQLKFHPNFERHQAEAGRVVVTEEEALQAWFGSRSVVSNRRRRRAPYLMLGATDANRAITVVLLRTSDPTTWLGYTAWDTQEQA